MDFVNLELKQCYLLLLTSCVLAFLLLNPLHTEGFGMSSDEGYYYSYAQTVKERGTAGLKELVNWYADNEEAKLHPAPIRVGYIYAGTFLFGQFSPSLEILGLFSICCFLLFLLMNYRFLSKYLGSKLAICIVLLLSCSPLLLALSRRALIDGPLNLFWGLFLWLLYDITASKGSITKYLFLCLSLSLCLLFKESSIALIPLAFILSWVRRQFGAFIDWLPIFISILGAILLYIGTLVLCMGDWATVQKGFVAIASTHWNHSSQSPYAVKYCSGPWFRYLLDFFLLNPVIFLLAVGYSFYVIAGRKLDSIAAYLFTIFVFIYAVFNLAPHSKVVRMVSFLEVILVILAVLGVRQFFAEEKRTGKNILGIEAVVALLAVFSFWQFYRIFFVSGLLDPISYHLLSLQGFVP